MDTLVTIRQTLRLNVTKFKLGRGVGIPGKGEKGDSGPTNTSAITLSHVTVDLDPFKKIIDENTGAVFITTRTKPVAPQYTHTIGTGEIPSSPDIQDYMCLLTIGGRSTSGVNQQIFWHLTIDGVEILDADSPGATVYAGKWWSFLGVIASVPIAVGQVLGVKFWSATDNLVKFEYATLYIVPKTLSVPEGFQTVSNGSGYTNAPFAGAVAGVAYQASNSISELSFFNAVKGVALIGSTGGGASLSTLAPPLQAAIAFTQVYNKDWNDIVELDSQSSTGPQLVGIGTRNLYRFIENYFLLVGDPVFTGIPLFEDLSLTNTVDGTDGTDGNAVFILSEIPLDLAQLDIMNEIQQVQGVAYDYLLNAGVPQITYRSGFIPVTGDHPIAKYAY